MIFSLLEKDIDMSGTCKCKKYYEIEKVKNEDENFQLFINFLLFDNKNFISQASADLQVQLNHCDGVYSNYRNTLLRNLKLSPYINFYV